MQTVKKVASVALSVVMWVIILVAALYAFTTLATRDEKTVANIAGFTPLTVQSNSMSPTFDEGDLIVIQTCDPATLQEGDIITFHTIVDNQYALNTHRIDSITENMGARSYTTKGDNNSVTDTHIISDVDIVGKYVGRVPVLGRLMTFLSSSTGFLVVIVIPMLLFFIYQVYHLIIVGMNLKRAMAAEETQQRAEAIVEADAVAADAEAKLAEAMRLKAEAEALLAASRKGDDGASGAGAGDAPVSTNDSEVNQ